MAFDMAEFLFPEQRPRSGVGGTILWFSDECHYEATRDGWRRDASSSGACGFGLQIWSQMLTYILPDFDRAYGNHGCLMLCIHVVYQRALLSTWKERDSVASGGAWNGRLLRGVRHVL